MTDDADLMVHDMIGRLFEEPEPIHRTDLADSAIAHGMAETLRRGVAVAGATLSVLAVVAGAASVSGGAQGSGDWSLSQDGAQVSAQAFEDPAPNYVDRQREIVQQLPGVFDPLLPAGMSVRRDGQLGDDSGSTLTGDFSPGFALHTESGDYVVRFDSDDNAYNDVFKTTSAVPVPVSGGSIRIGTQGNGSTYSSAWYEFTPAGAAGLPVRFNIFGYHKTSPLDAAAFEKIVEAPGFAKLQQLLDPSVRASAASVRQRYAVEAKINAEAAKVLPPGFRLKLSPGAPDNLELVGPEGVDSLRIYTMNGTDGQIHCPVDALCYSAESTPDKKVGPDGKARLGTYAGWSGTSPETSVIIDVSGVAGRDRTPGWADAKLGSETSPQGPGLTPQQAMAIVKAPGVAKVIADVQDLAMLK